MNLAALLFLDLLPIISSYLLTKYRKILEYDQLYTKLSLFNEDLDIKEVIQTIEGSVKLYAPHTLDKMRAAGRLAAQTLDYLTPFVTIGISTLDLNNLAHDFIIQHKAVPAPLNYKGLPKSICTSLRCWPN